MKFSQSFSALLAALLLASQAHARPAAAAAAAAAASNSTAASNSSTAATANNANPQTSLTLDPALIASGFAQNGQAVQEAGQVASLTSTNNFINFCATTKLPLTNGQQIKTGSCNPAPMGIVAGVTEMPSAKFVNPTNLKDIPSNTPFTITMAINNLATGNFVNAQQNYFSAPQQTDPKSNLVLGHSHVVVEAIPSITDTTPTNPNNFAFFKGLNAAAANGQLTADVTSGLPAGTYRLASINTAANHQPVLVAVAQHGSLDDMVYFTVGGGGAGAAANTAAAAAGGAGAGANSTAAAGAGANSTAAAGAAANSTAAAGAAANSTAAAGAAANSTAAAGAAAGAKGKGQKGKGQRGGKGGKGRRFVRDLF